jgi:hypothetical protein
VIKRADAEGTTIDSGSRAGTNFVKPVALLGAGEDLTEEEFLFCLFKVDPIEAFTDDAGLTALGAVVDGDTSPSCIRCCVVAVEVIGSRRD